jgi:NTP pyrophosphatase (non-canonical NTP hydrolase)
MSEDRLHLLQQKLAEFAKERDWQQFHSPKNLSMALIAEAAELIEHFQWLTSEQSDYSQLSAEKLKEISYELADIQIYLLRLSERLNINILDAVTEKMAINQQRFPIEKVKGKADYKSK